MTEQAIHSTLVSVIITCYNHARFLAEAIESVLHQTHPAVEIIVVDDGSTDHTRTVAQTYPEVIYIYQENQGLSAARNTGLAQSHGEYLLLLDADDKLLPNALTSSLTALRDNPECAFTSGHHRYIWTDGSFLQEFPQPQVTDEHYLALLRGNYIAMHGAVLFRRYVFTLLGAYDPTLKGVQDYDLYLRFARTFPVCQHPTVVAEYRRHESNMSNRPDKMLREVLQVLDRQLPYISKDGATFAAYCEGVRKWRSFYARKGWQQAAEAWRLGMPRESVQKARFWAVNAPRESFVLLAKTVAKRLKLQQK